jgi:5-formyltetrahydrofolate cyclo-ligase
MTRAADIRILKTEARRASQDRRTAAWTSWQKHAPGEAAQRLAVHADAVQVLVQKIVGAKSVSPAPLTVASGYLPMRTEIDPLALLAGLAQRGFMPSLPVVAARDAPLQFRAWTPGDPTVPAGFGTREPPPGNVTVDPVVLLVPLLAFDMTGYRLGYGGGYYDRTLRVLRARGPIYAIGVAFDEQKIDAVPHLDYDERMDAVVTPTGVFRLGG